MEIVMKSVVIKVELVSKNNDKRNYITATIDDKDIPEGINLLDLVGSKLLLQVEDYEWR